jgi:hypothetical protein
LIPADGFYKWRKTSRPKLSFAIAMKDGGPVTFAGLWENWKDPGSVVGAVFIIPRLRASLRQLKAAVKYGQVMPNMPQMGRFFSSMSGALQIATEGRAYHRRLLYA